MKIHIDIRNDIDPTLALKRVKEVIEKGRISNNGKNYCWSTVYSDDIVVAVREYRKSDCFVVYKKYLYK
jgi:hypothetical protein